MSRLLWHDVQWEKKPHRAAVTWSYSSARKRMVVGALRLFTTDETPVEIKTVPTERVSELLDQLTPPESC